MSFRLTNLTQHLNYNDNRYLRTDSTNGVTIGKDGNLILNGTARSWKDQLGDITALGQSGSGVSYNSTESSVDFTTLANLSDFVYTNVQINHEADLDADTIHPHIHWWQAYNVAPNFLLGYRWQTNGTVKVTSWTYIACNTNVYNWLSGTINQISYCAIDVPSTVSLSDIVQFKLFRDNANTSGVFSGSDTYTGTVELTSFDVHILINGFGSNDELAK